MKRQANKFDIIELYLSWTNDFLTTERYAEYYNVTEKQASKIIDLGRELHAAHNIHV